MPNGADKIAVMIAEKKDKNAVKIDGNVGEIDVMLGKTVIETAYAKELKMLVTDADQILNHTKIIAGPEAKIVNVRDKLTATDFFKATEMVTKETTTAVIVIAADINS